MAMLAGAWTRTGYVPDLPETGPIRIDVLLLTLVLMGLSVLLVRAQRRMTSILILGSIGFAIAALFALYGAPDLAITQILVETLTLLLFALAIYGMPMEKMSSM